MIVCLDRFLLWPHQQVLLLAAVTTAGVKCQPSSFIWCGDQDFSGRDAGAQAGEGDAVEYIPWDFKYFAKLRGNQILEDMQPVIRSSLDATGMFVCPPSSPSPEANRNAVSCWVSPAPEKGFLPISHSRKRARARRSMAL